MTVGPPPDSLAELGELADSIDVERDGTTTGIHPKEERGMYAARAMQSRYLTRYLYRLDEEPPASMDTPEARARAARAHTYVWERLRTGQEVIGSWAHLHDFEYRQARDSAADDEYLDLRGMEAEADDYDNGLTSIQAAARAAGVSRSTEYRRRKKAAA